MIDFYSLIPGEPFILDTVHYAWAMSQFVPRIIYLFIVDGEYQPVVGEKYYILTKQDMDLVDIHGETYITNLLKEKLDKFPKRLKIE